MIICKIKKIMELISNFTRIT